MFSSLYARVILVDIEFEGARVKSVTSAIRLVSVISFELETSRVSLLSLQRF